MTTEQLRAERRQVQAKLEAQPKERLVQHLWAIWCSANPIDTNGEDEAVSGADFLEWITESFERYDG